MNMKQLVAIARERGVSYQMSKAELSIALGLPPPAPNLLATLPPSPRMPVRTLRLIAKGRGYKHVYLMNRAKLYEVLGIPPPETTDISVCKLRLMAKEKGITQPHLIRKAELYEAATDHGPPRYPLHLPPRQKARVRDHGRLDERGDAEVIPEHIGRSKGYGHRPRYADQDALHGSHP
jgi:hypothetical protein